MTSVVFKLPRKHLPGVTPRMIARGQVQAARTGHDVEEVSPLANWSHGFSQQAAVEHYEGLGASLPGRPMTDPSMPDDVTQLTSDELGALYGQFVAYCEWLETESALAEVEADEREAYLVHVEAEIRLRKAGTVKDKDSKTANDPVFIQTQQDALVAKAKAKLLKARVRGYERCGNALSREMTRRVPTE